MDKPIKQQLNFPWLLKMAWRDSRRNRSRLILFMSSIILGIAALVAIFSLGDNVKADIDKQAKTLLGADLSVETNSSLKPGIQEILDTLADERSRETSFSSMVYFTKTGGTRLVQVRALEGNYPFYGMLETRPAKAGRDFRKAQQALVDKTLLLQFNAVPGDSIRVGEVTFEIAGALDQAPGQTGITSTIAPPVYIPAQYLDQTGLLQRGSRINYTWYFKYQNPQRWQGQISKMEEFFEAEGMDTGTVESTKRNTGRAFEDFSKFLTLISFIALLLGCIGIASSIQVYMREKIRSIAVIRCLGASSKQTLLIFFIQVVVIGFIGSAAGALLGTLVQQLLPGLLQDVIPVQLTTAISWMAIIKGLAIGVIIAALFSLLPLVSIRKISPLYTLRLSVEPANQLRDPLRWLIYLLVLTFIALFTRTQVDNWFSAIMFTLGILVAFLLLVGVAALLRWLVRRYFPASWSYLWRQGFANLYRPNNQTLVLVVTIGLGTTFMGTLYFVHEVLMNRVALSGSNHQPNMVLFDIQTAQKDAVRKLTSDFGLPIYSEVPIVTTRIESVKGINALMVKQDSTLELSPRVFEGELRVTFRDTLTESETIVSGKLGQRVTQPDDVVYVSLEDGYARRLRVDVGDTVVFNVQGAIISTVVGSLREVDWRRVQTNFRAIFPPGVLEKAPQFHVLITRIPSAEISAKYQQEIITNFPNLSIIDLDLILRVVDDVLSKIGFVIRFMAAFSILTGLIVLIASVFTSKYQRMQENVLLRTLGASGRQLYSITALEYFFLGSLAALTGMLLSVAGSWAIAKFAFDAPFSASIGPALLIFVAIPSLTVLIGLVNSRQVVTQTPLEVLRKEG